MPMKMPMFSLIPILTLILVLHCARVSAAAADIDASDSENQIKATYLYKFTHYVQWPVSAFSRADSPFMIGVVGSEAVAAHLRRLLQGRLIDNRAVEVNVIKPTETLANVHILFVSKLEVAALKQLLASTQSQPVLIVTDSNAGLGAGSVINFINVEDHIRFEISLLQAERCGLKISARLLNVAKKIESKRP